MIHDPTHLYMTSVTLHYIDQGEGSPVVILHGLFGSSRNWSPIAARLAPSHRVVSVDLRNHGASGHAPTMRFPELAGDVIALLDDLGIRETAVIGHSLGGKTAMTLALLHGDRISRLAVADIAPAPYQNNLLHLVEALESVPVDSIATRKQADEILSRMIPASALRRFLMQNLVLENNKYRWRINLPAIRANMRNISGFPEELGGRSFTGPALFLRGADSNYIRPEHHGVIRNYFPRAAIEEIGNAGHWVHADQPEIVIALLNEFLDGK